MEHKIAPSILSADFGNLANDIEMLNKSVAHYIHVDIMDGVFVPSIPFGFPLLKTIKHYSNKPLDVHLMIVEPERYIKDFKNAGANILTIHYEASTHLHRSIAAIKEEGMMAGVAINPHTSVRFLEDIIAEVDVVCLMSVNPGFGGQKFIENTYNKIKELKKLIQSKNSKALIEIDGGVSSHNSLALLHAGADILVAGNAVFSTEDPVHTISELKLMKLDTFEA